MKAKFELLFTKEFLSKLRRLDRRNQVRVLREMRTLEEKPFIGKQLTGRLTGLFSLRVGNYRIIYQIVENKVIIRTIGHRRTVYRR